MLIRIELSFDDGVSGPRQQRSPIAVDVKP
jgi:hypothetical protein